MRKAREMRNFGGTKLTAIIFLGIIFITSEHLLFHHRPTALINLTALSMPIADTYSHRSTEKSHPAGAEAIVGGPKDVHTAHTAAAADELNKSKPDNISNSISTTDRSQNWQPDWFTSDADTATILRERRRQITHRWAKVCFAHKLRHIICTGRSSYRTYAKL